LICKGYKTAILKKERCIKSVGLRTSTQMQMRKLTKGAGLTSISHLTWQGTVVVYIKRREASAISAEKLKHYHQREEQH
jgi:hypothetical protein